MRGEVVEVYSFVRAAGCENDLLRLSWDGCRRWRECQAPDGRSMSIEEEGICELDFVLG